MQFLKELLKQGTAPYQVVACGKEYLEKKGFLELGYGNKFELVRGQKYYVSPYPSMLFAFCVGEKPEKSVRLALAHTDFPCFRIKSNGEYQTKKYRQINVEPYGGMIKGSWFDRPLGIAGKVMLATANTFAPKTVFFDSKRALMTIPFLAPHMDSEGNKKRDFDMQTELMPVLGMITENCTEKQYLMRFLAEQLQVEVDEILSFDLYLYNMDQPEEIGIDKEFLSAPRIDNLASVSALLESITQAEKSEGLTMAALFDNEEIGSRSKQGADSPLLYFCLQKIAEALHISELELKDALYRGFLLSVDGAHALHPNYVSKSDITNEVFLGMGPVIKTSASQRYLSDSESTAILKQLCKLNEIPVQMQVNRSGMPGGSTLGPIVASYLPMRGADLGVPMLAMHSARELAAGCDYENLVKLLTAFWEAEIG